MVDAGQQKLAKREDSSGAGSMGEFERLQRAQTRSLKEAEREAKAQYLRGREREAATLEENLSKRLDGLSKILSETLRTATSASSIKTSLLQSPSEQSMS